MNNIAGQIVFRMFKEDTLDHLADYMVATMISSLIGIPLALITIKVIKDYTVVEPLLHNIPENVQATLVSEAFDPERDSLDTEPGKQIDN